ncbi:MAG: sulfotransferase [Planctomycetota bacterium]
MTQDHGFDAVYRSWRDRTDAISSLDIVFAVGCAKSGTTWLEKLLDGHPEMCVKGEGRHFWSLAQHLQKAFEAFNTSLPAQGERYLPWWSQPEFACVLRATIESTLARYIASEPPNPKLKIVGDKTPMHTLAVEPLAGLFPRAKFIHIIRDPRDATISQWLFWAKDNDPRPFEEFVEYSITQVWPLNVQTARTAGQKLAGRFAEVRYEDLIAEPEAQVTRLLEFLAVDASPEAVRTCLTGGSFKTLAEGRDRGSDTGTGHLFRKGVAGDWVNHIPPEFAERCCRKIEPLMRSCGYAVESPSVLTPDPGT